MLIRAQAEAAQNGTVMQIANPRGVVRRVLEITGVLDALTHRRP